MLCLVVLGTRADDVTFLSEPDLYGPPSGGCPDDYTHIDRAAVFNVQDVSSKKTYCRRRHVDEPETRERCNDCDGQKPKIDAENRVEKRIEGSGEREQSVRKWIRGE